MIRALVSADLGDKLRELRERRPGAVGVARPVCQCAASRAGRWASGVKPTLAYRYIDIGKPRLKKSVDVNRIRDAMGLPAKVEARKSKDEGDVLLVYGADGQIAGLELVRGDHEEALQKKTQALIDRTDWSATSPDFPNTWFWTRIRNLLMSMRAGTLGGANED
jgi:hypothetical protein